MSEKTTKNAAPHKIFYKGDETDFIVFVDSIESYKQFKKDSTVPLSDVVSVFQVFRSRTGGSEGVLEVASNSELLNQFNTKNVDEIILTILREGQDKSNVHGLDPRGYADKNDANGF